MDIPMELQCAAILQQLDMFLSTAQTLPWTCPLSYLVSAQCICPEAKVPPTPTQTSKDSSKSSDSSRPSGSSIWSSGTRQSVAHSLPGMRQPTGTGLSAARASMSQTQLTSALRQGYNYSGMRSQLACRSDMPVPVEAMSFRVPATQLPDLSTRLYSSLPQASTQSAQEVTHNVPVSMPVHPMTPAPALHSQNRGSIMAPIFQQRSQAK